MPRPDHGAFARAAAAVTPIDARAAAEALARQVGATVTVVDVGVATSVAGPGADFLDRNIARGTANLAAGPAMTAGQCQAALDTGAAIAALLVANGARALVTGEMGIGNTTPAAALIA